MLCVAALLACCSSAVLCAAVTAGREAAADAPLAEALAFFGAGPGAGAGASWRLARLEAALEGAGFHRRRRYEVVLQRGGACACSVGSGSGQEPAWLDCADAPPDEQCCSSASVPSPGPALESVEWVDVTAGGERGGEGVACEAAVLQVAASTRKPYSLHIPKLWRVMLLSCWWQPGHRPVSGPPRVMQRTSGRMHFD